MKRTTVRLSDGLMAKARKEAERRGTTLTALIEEGLTLMLTGYPDGEDTFVEPPVCRVGGGTLPGVELNDSARLLEVMEQE